MASNIGYGLLAGVQGFQSGFNMAQQKTEMDWQKKQQKKLEEQQLKLEEEASLYNSVVKQLGADGFYSEDDNMKISTTFLAMGYLTQERMKGAHDALMSMNTKAFDQEMEYFNTMTELLKSGLLDPKDATGVFNYFRENFAASEKVQNLYTAYDNVYAKTHGKLQEEKSWERAGTLPQDMRAPYLEQEGIGMPEAPPEAPGAPKMADEKSAIDILTAFKDATPEQFNNQKAILEQRFGLDLSNYTQDILKESGSEISNLYNTPEEVMSNVKAPAGLTVVPSRDSKTGKYYASFQKQAVGAEGTEGEITAGQKRSWDMASSVMFGSSDWVTGISKPGIISQSISSKLNMGQPLSNEENTEVRNNYNAIKDTLPDEIKSVIESQLQRYGISLEATAVPEPTPLPEQPGLIEKGVTAVKDFFGKKGTPEAQAGKDYTTMGEEELYNLAMAGDKLAYEEAKRRGLIK